MNVSRTLLPALGLVLCYSLVAHAGTDLQPIKVQAPGTVVISNTKTHHDAAGNLLDAHDGNTVQFKQGGLYYMYAMSYGTCKERLMGCLFNKPGVSCGFRFNHNVTVLTSPDLTSWTVVGDALPVANRPNGIYYRPKVVYNPVTKLYVLWVNYLADGTFHTSTYLVATSATPEGPFDVKDINVKTRYPLGGDFDIFVDDEGTGYISYTSISSHHSISVEVLKEDLLGSKALNDPVTQEPTASSSGFFAQKNSEAVNMFKRNGLYYVLLSRTCCFCKPGAGADVYIGKSPLGPFEHHGDIGKKKFSLGSITHSQQNCIIKVATTKGDEFLWTGDRWQSAPDKIKAHDLQYWYPMEFNEDGSIQKMKWVDSFTLDLA